MRLGYILSRYPLLSETFILREMQELERRGHNLAIFPLLAVTKGMRHDGVAELRARVWQESWLPLASLAYWAVRAPITLLGTLVAAAWSNRSDRRLLAGVLAYWPKALVIARRMRNEGIGQVHAHYATHPAYVAWVVKKLTGIPYSFTVHAHDLYCHRAMLGTKVMHARGVITISDYNRRLLGELMPQAAAATPITVVRCGVRVANYERLASGRPESPRLRVLSVGSLQPYKGQAHLIAACARLCRQGVELECRIVGGGELRRSLERQIEGERLERRVRLVGPQTEQQIQAWLKWGEVFVLPSIVDARTGQTEGIPVALMEAMAAGMAVVASKLSGIPELVQSGEGLLVAPCKPEEIAAALLRLRDPELRRQLGVAAQKRVRREYDLPTNVAALAAALGWSVAQREAAA